LALFPAVVTLRASAPGAEQVMAKNILVINVDIRETRVALIENGIIAELHIERETQKGTLGNIYLGKVSRVLPGMQAAFIDVGLERAAFLHVEDLIRPDDFEAYLAGHRRPHEEERAGRPSPAQALADDVNAADQEGATHDAAHAADDAPEGDVDAHASEGESEGEGDGYVEPMDADAAHAEAESAIADEAVADEPGESEPEPEVEAAPPASTHRALDPSEPHTASLDIQLAPPHAPEPDIDAEDAPLPRVEAETDVDVDASADTKASPGAPQHHGDEEPAPVATTDGAPVEGEPDVSMTRTRSRRSRGGRVRRSGSTADRKSPAVEQALAATPQSTASQPAQQQQQKREGGGQQQARGDRQGNRGRDDGRRSGRNDRGGSGGAGRGGSGGRGGGRQGGSAKKGHDGGMRVSKQTPIREVVREGQEVVVQISKEPIGTKGARVTSHVSLPGRYVVYLPTVEHVGISKRIGSDKERSRLREAIEAMKPPQGGLIVRTMAEGLTKKQLKADIGYLVRLWGEVIKKREVNPRPPVCLYTELDLVTKTARDLFTDDIEKIVIDSREEYVRLKKFIEMFMPERADAVELYEDEEPIFDAYGIEEEIQRAQQRKVPLTSGGHLIIDQAEALTAIDVNTGRFVGKGSKDLEETILMTNLEAVEEIAYQLRFRNIGGLIILDLIDMERTQNREKVRKRLEELLLRDKAKTTLNRISDLGLIEMTRKRTRESLGRVMLEDCPYCSGDGQIQSKQTVSYEILRQIRRQLSDLPGYSIVVNAHPDVCGYLKGEERVALTEAERIFQRRIELVPRKEFHLEQFVLQGR
jgi:ribonuclease G